MEHREHSDTRDSRTLRRPSVDTGEAELSICVFSDDMPASVEQALFEIHLEGFGELAEASAMRHVYSQEEWHELMVDPRILKFVALIGDKPVGINSGATDLSAAPWLSPEFFIERFPGRRILYDMDTIVARQARGARVVLELFAAGLAYARSQQAVIVLSTTRSHVKRGFVDLIQAVVQHHCEAPVIEVDSYHYFAFDSVFDPQEAGFWDDLVGTSTPGFEDLAPSIHRQRLVVEGVPTRALDDLTICSYLCSLSDQLGMTTISEAVTHKSERYGWAGWIHWENSGAHMCAWNEPLFFSVDIYTCAAFPDATAVEFTRDYLGATKIIMKSF